MCLGDMRSAKMSRIRGVKAEVSGTKAPSDQQIEASARIWAAATCKRDGLAQPVPWVEKINGIRRRLLLPEATLFMANLTEDPQPVGFALAATQSSSVEVFYLAVAPEVWGNRLAATLLGQVDRWAMRLGHRQLRLWVLDDNLAAQREYGRAGWSATNETQQDAASGRVERLFVRVVA